MKPTDNNKHIRFQQRFSNLEKAYQSFESALARDTSNDALMRAGLIKTFEFTFELTWKTIEDKLESDGINTLTPRDAIKEAFDVGIIDNGQVWIEALESRNEMSHTYDEVMSKAIETKIRAHFAPAIKQAYAKLKNLI